MLCPNVRVHSFCDIEQSILMPGVRVGRHARIRRAIIDRDVFIPRGALIGYNAEEDRRRHTVTDSGIVVVTTDDEPFIGEITDEALQERGGVRSARSGDGRTTEFAGSTSRRFDERYEVRARLGLRTRQKEHVKIQRVHGREILDSRGNPTVEVDVTLEGGAIGRAAVPSGASTGQREALELRDGDKKRYLGKGVSKGGSPRQRRDRDGARRARRAISAPSTRFMIELDGTPNKGRLGANALLGVSMALARANATGAARAALRAPRARRSYRRRRGAPDVLPVPMMNILNGGAHADSSVDFQEFMVMPVGAPSFAEAVRTGAEIFHTLRGILKKKGLLDRRRRRGRLRAQPLVEPRSARRRARGGRPGRLQARATTSTSRSTSPRASCGTTAAQTYEFKKSGDKTRTADEMVALYEDWVRQYPIISIEDGLAEGDWDGWKTLTKALGAACSSSATTCS